MKGDSLLASAITAGFLTFSVNAYAQSASCIESAQKTISAPSSTQLMMLNMVSEIAKRTSISANIRVISCDFFQGSVSAYVHKKTGSEDTIPEGEYIIYNPRWVQQTSSTEETRASFLIGHELGHFVSRHFDSNPSFTRMQELEADKFGACVTAKMGGSWEELNDFLKNIREEVGQEYPSYIESATVAEKEFRLCGGTTSVQEEKICRVAENGIESWGLEVSIERSSNWRDGGGSQPGYCNELVGELRQEYPNATEFSIQTSWENTRNTCRPFNCPQYKYSCIVNLKGNPFYKLAASSKCL